MTGKWQFVSNKFLKSIEEGWKAGAVAVNYDAKIEKTKYTAYVTIYDFAVNLKEDIKAGKVETINETIVGIQVKVINNENTQYVVGSGQGRASTIGQGFLKNPNMEWNQSSLSSASNKAMETAVVNVIKAIDRRGW